MTDISAIGPKELINAGTVQLGRNSLVPIADISVMVSLEA